MTNKIKRGVYNSYIVEFDIIKTTVNANHNLLFNVAKI